MTQTSLITILVFVAGLGSGYFARSAVGMLQRRTPAADLASIEKLNQEDIEATLARDQKRLRDDVRNNPSGLTVGTNRTGEIRLGRAGYPRGESGCG